jgi:HAMP domain-containing protein
MKLTTKWLLWFLGIGLYVMALGGVFYYNLFKWTFDEKLKMDIIETVKIYAPTLREGLMKNPKAITMEEYNIMSDTLSKDERITSVLYMNRFGLIRWHREASYIGVTYDEFSKNVPPLTDAIRQAYDSLAPRVRPVPKQPLYEVAIPLTVSGEVVGIVDLIVSRASSDLLINSAMSKYIIGAIGVLFLLGLPFYFFFRHYVISPLEMLSEAISSISFKSFELRFPKKSDEIGLLADNITYFMEKTKKEIETLENINQEAKLAEEKWWRSLLRTLVNIDEYVIVVDENNNILYANFELNMPAESKNVHLLDVVDSQQQNLLRLIGSAYEKPEMLIEGEAVFKGNTMKVKVIHAGEGKENSRTLIYFQKKNI